MRSAQHRSRTLKSSSWMTDRPMERGNFLKRSPMGGSISSCCRSAILAREQLCVRVSRQRPATWSSFKMRTWSMTRVNIPYFLHMVGNRFLTLLSNMFTNLNLTDMETCYKVFRREFLDGITIEENRFGFEPEITAKVAKAGSRVFEVGISYNGRTYEEGKKIGWRDGVKAIYVIVKYNLFRRNKELWKDNTQESMSSKRSKARTTTTII